MQSDLKCEETRKIILGACEEENYPQNTCTKKPIKINGKGQLNVKVKIEGSIFPGNCW